MRYELDHRCIIQFMAEPSFKLFKYKNMFCLMARGYSYSWCGYVSVDPVHPLYGKSYNDLVKVPNASAVKFNGNYIGLLCTLFDPLTTLDLISIDVALTVHGGVTFAAPYAPGITKQELGDLWWFGFDTAHYGDITPIKTPFSSSQDDDDSLYRNYWYVYGQVISLADQLSAFLPPKPLIDVQPFIDRLAALKETITNSI